VSGGRLEVRGLAVTLGRTRVLAGIDLEAPPGSWTAVVGPNGAGKSTLLRALAGTVRYEGQVLLDGEDLGRLPARRRARSLGYAPQVPVLPEGIAVRDYVALGRTPYHSLLTGPRTGDLDLVAEALDRLDLTALGGRTLRTLSGGERQRAVLARALAQEPRVLLLDEPTAAQDLGHAQQLLELIDRLRGDTGLTVVASLHDLTLAAQYAQRLVLLAHGAVAASGTPAEVLTADALAAHYGASARVESGPDGVRVLPVRP
jgi:iron complex transport system ATP-binding protein